MGNQPKQNEYYKVPFESAEKYDDEDEIRNSFQSLALFNHKIDTRDFPNAQFFVVRSKNRDDIHKAMKYGVWTSSYYNNKKFKEACQQGPVFFIFTILKTNKFVGIAQIIDKPDLKIEFPYWGEIGKWKGIIKIRWLFVRDIHFESLDSLEE